MKDIELATGLQNARINTAGAYVIVNGYYLFTVGIQLHNGHIPIVRLGGHPYPRRDTSPRWKEIFEPSPGRFTHHLELYSARDIDNEVHDWLHEAWLKAA